ncbi:MAG: hemolysin family protein [Chloroflexota bacterium]|nr:hemolysin family protein [Chloroflexota bacterium]
MTEETLIIFIVTAVVFLLDLLVSVVKASFSHARLPYLLNLRESREESVARTVRVIEEPRLRISLRLAAMLFHFLLAGLLTLLLKIYQPELNLWLLLLYLLIGMLLIVLIEYGIEAIFIQSAEENAIRLRFIGSLINIVFSPLSGLLQKISGPEVKNLTMASMTEEDLKNWVEADQPEGSLEKGEREMIYSIFQFGDTLAKEIMVPRIDVLALDINVTLGEARETFVRAGHSRVPVYQDTVDNVIGLLYAKDLLSVKKDDESIADHRELLRLAYFVPEAKKIDELLAEMQTRSMHMAIVVDEYGGVAGVVTLEDIVEEIIGEIRDEYDESEEMPYQKVSDDEYVFLGRVDLDIFNEVMGTQISTENADTIGGYIYGEIGDVPIGGETLKADKVTLTVDQVVGRRITKVRAKRDTIDPLEKEVESADEGNTK